MRKKYKVLTLTLGVVFLLGILGVGAIFAAAPEAAPGDYHQVFVSKLAKILGVDEQKLAAGITQAQSETLDQAVKDGKLTKEQADTMKQHMQQGGFGPGFAMGSMPDGMHAGMHGSFMGGMPFGSTPPTIPGR